MVWSLNGVSVAYGINRAIHVILFSRNHVNTHSQSEILIASELCNSSIRAERAFVIRYPNKVIRSICGNLEVAMLVSAGKFCSQDFSHRLWPEVIDGFFKLRASVALLNSLADFAIEIISVAMHLIRPKLIQNWTPEQVIKTKIDSLHPSAKSVAAYSQ